MNPLSPAFPTNPCLKRSIDRSRAAFCQRFSARVNQGFIAFRVSCALDVRPARSGQRTCLPMERAKPNETFDQTSCHTNGGTRVACLAVRLWRGCSFDWRHYGLRSERLALSGWKRDCASPLRTTNPIAFGLGRLNLSARAGIAAQARARMANGRFVQ
jgi:hypothetical protein